MMNIQENVLLSKHTTFRLGGPARFFVEVKSVDELKEALDFAKSKKLDFFILGGGSNLLVADVGFAGLVVKMKITDYAPQVIGNKRGASVGAGMPLARIVNEAAREGWQGLEWATGIPGTVGGAIRGNAGAYGGEMKDVIESVTVLDAKSGEIKEISGSDCNFSYRESRFKTEPHIVIFSAKLKFESGNSTELQKKMKDILSERRGKSLHAGGSAGSYFINPVIENADLISDFERETGKISKGGKVPSGWLIEKSGLKGKKIGGAMVSSEHANYIVNTGTATADDIIMLDSLVKQQVRDKFGVQLREEVQYLGFNQIT